MIGFGIALGASQIRGDITPPVPPNNLVDESSNQLTDEDGNPLIQDN